MCLQVLQDRLAPVADDAFCPHVPVGSQTVYAAEWLQACNPDVPCRPGDLIDEGLVVVL